MKVLVACEYSGVVRDAFRKLGHNAISCDLLPTERPSGPHLTGDVLAILDQGWDLMIAHPPCTHLVSSGAASWPAKQKDGRQQAAIEFFLKLYNAPIERVAIENPAGILSSVFRKPDQYVHPYQFGDPYLKRTGLWLRGLPKLVPTDIVEPKAFWHSGSGYNKDGTRKSSMPSLKGGWKERSRTFEGIAKAIAEQWGSLRTKGKGE